MSARVTDLDPRHAVEAAALLGRAFRDNPVNVAVIGRGPDARERISAAGAVAYMPGALELGRVWGAWLGDELAGVLVALPPGRTVLPVPRWRAWGRLLWEQGPRVVHRFGEVAATLHERHPVVPHWTLATLGVDPPHWRRGVGRALVRALVAAADRAPHGIYLDTDRGENVAFYSASGFEVVGTLDVAGVRVHRMWRPAPGMGDPAQAVCDPRGATEGE